MDHTQEAFSDNGGLFRMQGGVSAAAQIDIGESHGVPEVSSCDGTTSNLATAELAPVELLITDTMLNQIFYAAWSAGLLEFAVDSNAVFTDIEDVGISNIVVSVRGLSPPTATSCTPDGELLFHIGDMRTEMAFDLNGLPVNATAHTSFTTELFLTPTADNSAILIELGELKSPSLALEDPINTDIAIMEDEQIDIGPIVINLINDNLVDSLLTGLSGGFGTIPLPQFDITGVAEGSSMSLVQQPGDNSVYHFGNSSVVNAKFIGQ
ncbi:MAG: hypothetical protein GY822_11820 [Deltaproteobacteria bacterium]|nr:hypothetical protein [Deltaproteobacteria bacterium]